MWKKTSANLASLLALLCRIGEFSCVPPHNEAEKPLGPHYQLVQNFCQLFLANGHICFINSVFNVYMSYKYISLKLYLCFFLYPPWSLSSAPIASLFFFLLLFFFADVVKIFSRSAAGGTSGSCATTPWMPCGHGELHQQKVDLTIKKKKTVRWKCVFLWWRVFWFSLAYQNSWINRVWANKLRWCLNPQWIPCAFNQHLALGNINM